MLCRSNFGCKCWPRKWGSISLRTLGISCNTTLKTRNIQQLTYYTWYLKYSRRWNLDCGLLRYDTVQSCMWLTTFRRNTLPPRSRYSDKLLAGRSRGRSSSPSRAQNFLFSTSSRRSLGSTQPPIQWVPGTLSPGVKWQGREADHSSPANAEVNKMWIYTSTPPYAFMALCLIS
jgi:hypothetical protein